MEYTLDAAAAKKADVVFSKIEEKGKYLGTFTRAEAITAKSGAKGVEFSFKSDAGASADYLTIYTHKSDGTTISGYNLLMAIMTCLRVRNLKPEAGEVEKYDSGSGQRAKVQAMLFKELMGKPIGLLLNMEEYEKAKGGTAWKPAIVAPFDKDEFTASEILSQAKQPETLGKMVQGLRDRPLKNKPASTGGQPAAADNGFSDMGDDIPW